MSRYEDLSDDGEVDHAFFDSDVDEGTGNVKQKGPRGKDDQHKNGSLLKAALESKKGSSSEEEKERPVRHTDRPNTASTAASVLVETRSESTLSSGSTSAQNFKINTSVPTGIPKIRREYEDSFSDEEDSSDEANKQRYRPKSAKQQSSFRKHSGKKVRNFHFSASSSDGESTDSTICKSEPSCSKSKVKESASASTLSSPERRVKSAGKSSDRNEKLCEYHDESEDTVTDVTPLSTPDISPIQSFDFAATNEMKKKIMQRQENVSQEIYDPEVEDRTKQKALHDAMDLNQLLKAFMHLDKKEQRNVVIDHPAITRSKNYSFTNEEVRHIERENQRLLKELSRQASKPRSKSITPKKSSGPPPKLYHTTINRQREQLRIERDNMALLKRLESIKPTVGMKRSEQLMDYQRQVGYLGSSATSPRPVKSSAGRIGTSASCSRSSSAVTQRSERSASSTSSSALLRPTKSTNVRAAWL
ncbi:cilia- and flagella-associated protein 97 [Ambystoma mexicanum]|uniref:cilia- and flagella-associated protein 97 n=1 Tax=Ambystoma mexicanum TaxID=8296 RepID=UPI0037E938A5